MFKKMLFLFIVAATVLSCDSDDDLALVPTVQINEFIYGPMNARSNTAIGYNDNFDVVGNGVVQTSVILGDSNFEVDGNDDFTGRGFAVNLDFYSTSNLPLPDGRYDITSTRDAGTATVTFNEDFDTTSPRINNTSLDKGTLAIETSNGRTLLEIIGTDVNGDRFYGVYAGRITMP
ncbi:MAG: hypothetical protein WBA16_11010 [Nonlabens sp.]